MVNQFSDVSKTLITIAAEIAFDLGNDKVSTIHFFLANCKMINYNPRDFLFSSEDAFNIFYESQRIGDPKILDYSKVPELTKEAKKTIVYSVKFMKKFRSEQIQPVHLLLAATRIKNSQFASICNNSKNATILLYNFYKEKGYLREMPSLLLRIVTYLFLKKGNNNVMK